MDPQLHKPMLAKWPDFIFFEGREVRRTGAEPSFATYTLPGAYMNKNLYLTRREWEAHVRGDKPKPKKEPKYLQKSKNPNTKKTWADLARS